MRLIPDARHAWRFGSVQAALLLAVLSGIQAEVMPLVSPLFSPEVWPWVSGLLALAVVLLRVVVQPAVERVRRDEAQAAFEKDLAEFRAEVDQILDLGRQEKERTAATCKDAL